MIKNNLKRIVIERALQPYVLAREAGISYMTVYLMLKDKSTGIQYETLSKLCKYLNCGVSDILEYTGD